MANLLFKKIKHGKTFTRFGKISQLNINAIYNFCRPNEPAKVHMKLYDTSKIAGLEI